MFPATMPAQTPAQTPSATNVTDNDNNSMFQPMMGTNAIAPLPPVSNGMAPLPPVPNGLAPHASVSNFIMGNNMAPVPQQLYQQFPANVGGNLLPMAMPQTMPFENYTYTTTPMAGSELVNVAATEAEAERSLAHSQMVTQAQQAASQKQPKQQGPAKDKKQRKAYVITKPRENWTPEEHHKFLQGLKLYERDWKLIHTMIKTKSVIQIRSHAQKYFLKMTKSGRLDLIPPPRPKKPEVDDADGKTKSSRSRSRSTKGKGSRRKKSTPPSLSDNAGPIHSMPKLDDADNVPVASMSCETDLSTVSGMPLDSSSETPAKVPSSLCGGSPVMASKFNAQQDQVEPFLLPESDVRQQDKTEASPEDYWNQQFKNIPPKHLELQQSLNCELVTRARSEKVGISHHKTNIVSPNNDNQTTHDFEKMYSFIASLVDPTTPTYDDFRGSSSGYGSDNDTVTSACSSMATVTDNDYDSDYCTRSKKPRSDSLDSSTSVATVSLSSSAWEMDDAMDRPAENKAVSCEERKMDDDEEENVESALGMLALDEALLSQLAHTDKELFNTLLGNLADNLENSLENKQKNLMRSSSSHAGSSSSLFLFQEAFRDCF